MASRQDVLVSGPQDPYSCKHYNNAPQGKCFYDYVDYITGPEITGAPYTNQNIWGANSGYYQEMHVAAPNQWYILSRATATDGAVLTYPNTGWSAAGPWDQTSEIISSWDVSFPHNTGPDDGSIVAWACYDLWFNDWGNEVMIEVDIAAPSWYACTPLAVIQVDGLDWHLCKYGTAFSIWKPGTSHATHIDMPTGTIDIQPLLAYLVNNGHLPVGSTWTAGSFGYEVCNTAGQLLRMDVNDFTWRAQ